MSVGPFRFIHSPNSRTVFVLDENRKKERWEHRAIGAGTLDVREIYRYLDQVSRVDSATAIEVYGAKPLSWDELRVIKQTRMKVLPLRLSRLSIK